MLTDEEIMRQVLAAFQEEQTEHCQAISTILLELERQPDHPRFTEHITQLFREAHSLKGGARAAGIESVEVLAHKVEDLFSAVRQGTIALSADVCDPVYAAVDAIGVLMGQVTTGRTPNMEPYQPILDRIGALLHDEPVAPAQNPPSSEADADQSENLTLPQLASVSGAEADEEQAPMQLTAAAAEEVPWETASTTVRLSTAMLDSLMNETGELIISAARSQQQFRDTRALADLPAGWRRIWRQVRPVIERVQKQQMTFQPTVHHLQDRGVYTNGATVSDTSATQVRLDTEAVVLLDALLQANTLINSLEQRLINQARRVGEDSARLSAVTGRLQDQIRRTRMLPLLTLLNPLRVQLREMARMVQKQVVIETDDKGAEADRQVLEGLREVLLHLLRNAIDHGIEAPDIRERCGKPPVGRLNLQTMVSGDYLDLTLSDDGAGLDIVAITQTALERGFLTESELSRTSEADILDLIFLPGFSTRHVADALSGRGVGLDVVRSSVERMHGFVSVHSTPGLGCTFTIRVPLSLTSSHGLLLRVGRATYMLPLEAVQRIVPVAPQDIQFVEGRAVLKLDDQPTMLINLADLLGETAQAVPAEQYATTKAREQNGGHPTRSLALLLGSGDRQVACMVDEVVGEQELVVHRLPAPLQRVRFLAGATILPDGSVVPILDLVDVLRAAVGMRNTLQVTVEEGTRQQRIPTVLVADDSITTRTLEKNILEAAGYYVHLATDGVEAIQVLQRLAENGGCDLLVSDIDMPRLNGFDLTTQVRTDPNLKHLPIVLVTSLDTSNDRERGMSAGADAYIVKRAFDQQTLLDTIARLIG